MATDATGTPTSPDNIPTYDTSVDNPSGKGFNAAMAAVQTALSARAPIVSPVLAGTPTAPTPVTGDNSTSIATTAYVKAQNYITTAGFVNHGVVLSASSSLATLAPGANGQVLVCSGGTSDPVWHTLLASDVANAADKAAGSVQTFVNGITSTSPTAGIGYATGAGNTVTQTVVRTNPVTIGGAGGCVTGQITTFNDSVSANTFQFTVNNAAILATDTIILTAVTVHDPTDTYRITNVANGSFKISYTSTASFSTAFVFNFAVIRAVTS